MMWRASRAGNQPKVVFMEFNDNGRTEMLSSRLEKSIMPLGLVYGYSELARRYKSFTHFLLTFAESKSTLVTKQQRQHVKNVRDNLLSEFLELSQSNEHLSVVKLENMWDMLRKAVPDIPYKNRVQPTIIYKWG